MDASGTGRGAEGPQEKDTSSDFGWLTACRVRHWVAKSWTQDGPDQVHQQEPPSRTGEAGAQASFLRLEGGA